MENNEIIISIIIPVYNVEKYIGRCLDSLDKQDLSNVEIILVNDGSTDNSADVCENFAKSHGNASVISQQNGGLSAARNTGIAHARGEYLLFLDSDDWLNDGAVAGLKTLLQNGEQVDIIFGKPICHDDLSGETSKFGIDYDIFKKYKSPSELFYRLLKINNFWFAAWLCIVRRSFIAEKGLYFEPNIYHEDELWVPQIMIHAGSIRLWNEGFYVYRTNRADSIISKVNIKKELDKAIVMQKLLLEKSEADKYGKLIVKDRIAALEWGLINNYYKFQDDPRVDELYNVISENFSNMKAGKYILPYLYIKIISLKSYLHRK